MNTLGYSDEERLARSDIAKIQLEKAIDLFIFEQFIPSITLAGAAEEIFGKLLLCQKMMPVLEESFGAIQGIRDAVGLNLMDGKSKKEIIKDWNYARNNLKHYDLTDEEFVVLNTCDEAYWMIKRALNNAGRLGVVIKNHNDFENWVIINVNM